MTTDAADYDYDYDHDDTDTDTDTDTDADADADADADTVRPTGGRPGQRSRLPPACADTVAQ
jgi:hypothetical protein